MFDKDRKYLYTAIALAISTLIQLWIYFKLVSANQVHYQEYHYLLLVILLTLLAIVNQLDLKVRVWLQASDTPMTLDRAGIQIINEQANLGIRLIHDQDFQPKIIKLGQISKEDEHMLKSALTEPKQHKEQLSTELKSYHQQQLLKLEDFAECRVLPNLPMINGRLQVGLFATQEIPQNSIFLWQSDIAILLRNNQDLLGVSERINQRPLARDRSALILQSGGLTLRSNPITLINFAWCHTDSIDTQSSPYRILPPNDLGQANCHFASVNFQINKAISLCSAIVNHETIRVGEQLLAYSGSGHNARVVWLRRLLSKSLDWLSPALVVWPWLRLYQSLS